MGIQRLLRAVLPNATWDFLKYLVKLVAESGVLTAFIGIIQKVREVDQDWLVLGSIFCGSLLLLWWTSRPSQKRENFHRLPSSLGGVIEQTSPRDAANREKIAVLARAGGHLAYEEAQQVANRLWDLLCRSEKAEVQMLALFFHDLVLEPCRLADVYLHRSLTMSPDKENTDLLQQRFQEFFHAYQLLVQWVNRLAQQLNISLRVESQRYGEWQEKHKMFYHELQKFLAVEDFVQLRRRLLGKWTDLQG